MSRNHLPVVLSLVLLAGCATWSKTMTPAANTRDAVMSYVNHAADVVGKSDPSCDTFRQPMWMAGDNYIFVIGPDNRLLCHPNTQLIGRLQSEIIDANGMRVGDALGATAAARPAAAE